MTLSIRSPTRPLRVCIVSHFAYPAFAGKGAAYIGGVERQTSMLARWLASRGHQISLVTWDEGQPESLENHGVRLVKLCSQTAGMPGLRFFHPRWTSLNAALRKADADIYYHNCGEYVTGQIALWCRRRQRKFVYSAAALGDCDIRLPLLRTVRERVLYRLGIRWADQIIVQTKTQLDMLRQGFNRDGLVIPMPVSSPTRQHSAPRTLVPVNERKVLWVGRISEEKRPDRLLDVAERCPDLEFDLVGPSAGSEYAQRVLARAQKLANVTAHGGVTQEQLSIFYQRASCLCSTSDHEGFPNVFLEAWSYGLPIVATLDPDHVIVDNELGLVATDIVGLEFALRQLFLSQQGWQLASQNAQNYYVKNHCFEQVMPRFEQVFLSLLQESAKRSGIDHVSGEQALS